MKCKFNDCGWRYSNADNTNAEAGACKKPIACEAHSVNVIDLDERRNKKAIDKIKEQASKLDF
jgi:hypothetical protein